MNRFKRIEEIKGQNRNLKEEKEELEEEIRGNQKRISEINDLIDASRDELEDLGAFDHIRR